MATHFATMALVFTHCLSPDAQVMGDGTCSDGTKSVRTELRLFTGEREDDLSVMNPAPVCGQGIANIAEIVRDGALVARLAAVHLTRAEIAQFCNAIRSLR